MACREINHEWGWFVACVPRSSVKQVDVADPVVAEKPPLEPQRLSILEQLLRHDDVYISTGEVTRPGQEGRIISVPAEMTREVRWWLEQMRAAQVVEQPLNAERDAFEEMDQDEAISDGTIGSSVSGDSEGSGISSVESFAPVVNVADASGDTDYPRKPKEPLVNAPPEKPPVDDPAILSSVLPPLTDLIFFTSMHQAFLLNGRLEVLASLPYVVSDRYIASHELHRLSMARYIPELSLMLVASQAGQIALVRILRFTFSYTNIYSR